MFPIKKGIIPTRASIRILRTTASVSGIDFNFKAETYIDGAEHRGGIISPAIGINPIIGSI